MKTVTKTITLYSISELKEANPKGYERALNEEKERHETEWQDYLFEERFEGICDQLGEPGLKVLSWDPYSAPLTLCGEMTVPSEFEVQRVLRDEDPLETVTIGESREWTGWRYYIHENDLSEEEAAQMLLKKRELETQIAQLLYADLELFTAEHTLIEYSEMREAVYEIDGEENWI